MTKARKPPRWVTPFLRALARTGQARAAAEDAGIDYTTAYARRKAHAEFASLWRGALAAHAQFVKRDEDEEIRALEQNPSTIHSSVNGPCDARLSPGQSARLGPPAELGEELVASGGQMKRAGHGRWSQAKERIFFEELAATANARRAAKAAGVSTNAVLARRLKHRVFRAKWEAIVATARSSIDLYLVEASNQTFDPEALDTGEVHPKVTISEAIKISQRPGGAAVRGAPVAEPEWDEIEPSNPTDEVCERLLGKLKRMHKRDIVDKQAAGWSYDESYDVLIPPGWVQGPDYEPKTPEAPVDFDALYR
jgi:hypothetical protein